jgi:hypothetical protein
MDEDGITVTAQNDHDRFKFGRAGDNFMTMFQCDLCHFRNIQKRDPLVGNVEDICSMRNIRRASLDALWSRESGTVKKNLSSLRQMCKLGECRLGYDSGIILPAMGPWEVEDKVGMRMASITTERSLDKGINEATIQHGTARKFRAVFSNMWSASLEGVKDTVAVRDTVKMSQTSCPTFGTWYEKFGLGLHKRMGDVVRQDQAISIEVMLALMDKFEAKWQALERTQVPSPAVAKVLFPALFSVVAFVIALRGEEVPLMDLAAARNNFVQAVMTPPDDEGTVMAHAVIPLLGRFKGEHGEKYHYMVTVLETKSGLKPGKWIGRMLEYYQALKITSGPVFRDKKGQRVKIKAYEEAVMELLEEIQRESPCLIGENVDVRAEYGLGRSWRRGSDSRAMAEDLSTIIINLNNRWRAEEKAKGRQVSRKMLEHYAEVRLLLKTFLGYSRGM